MRRRRPTVSPVRIAVGERGRLEAGSADFTGHAKQSRSTLAPIAAYEGSDKPVPLREHLDLVRLHSDCKIRY